MNRCHICATRVATTGIAAVMLVLASGDASHAQTVRNAQTCVDFRAPEAMPLVKAAESKRKGAIAEALLQLSRLPRFATPKDPTNGRRPVSSSYKIQFTDRQIERRARNLFDILSARNEWRQLGVDGRRLRTVRFDRMAGSLRTLLILADAFPTYETDARALALEMGDAVLATRRISGAPIVPLAPAARVSRRNPFLRTSVRNAVQTCAGLRTSLVSGWLISTQVPEAHYRDTALVGEAMIALGRSSGEKRFVDWARSASDQHARHALVGDIHANAMAAGLDADLYSVTANELYLERARERFVLGVLPAFETDKGRLGSEPFITRLPLGDLAEVSRALMHVATAFAAAPVRNLPEETRQAVERAAQFAYADLQKRATQARRLQYPAQLIELSFDAERAQRAGATVGTPDPEAFRHTLAHGADRVKRFIPLSGAASGLLLARLKNRGWAGAYRTPERAEAE